MNICSEWGVVMVRAWGLVGKGETGTGYVGLTWNDLDNYQR